MQDLEGDVPEQGCNDVAQERRESPNRFLLVEVVGEPLELLVRTTNRTQK